MPLNGESDGDVDPGFDIAPEMRKINVNTINGEMFNGKNGENETPGGRKSLIQSITMTSIQSARSNVEGVGLVIIHIFHLWQVVLHQ